MAGELVRTDGDGDDLGEDLGAGLMRTPKEEAFCRAYGDPESETYSRGTASAAVAGYASPHSAAFKLRQRPQVIERLEEFQVAARAAQGRVLSDLEHVRLLALKDGSAAALSVAARCSELCGKHLAMFAERVMVDEERRREYSDAERAEAARLTRLLLQDEGAVGLGVLPPERQLTAGDPGQEENDDEKL